MEKKDLREASILLFGGVSPQCGPLLRLEPRPLPTQLAHGEILAKIRLCSICGSDLHTLSGKRSEPIPSVLGHEAVGEVVSLIGREADDITTGDRITFSVADSCFECPPCLDGFPQKCKQLFKYGHAIISNGTGFNGCYASHIVIRKGTTVVKVPNHVTDSAVVSANCALATMVNAVSQVSPHTHRETTVLIQGAGLLGVYGCALFRDRGYTKVFCTDINSQRLNSVARFGGIPWNTATGELPDCPPEEGTVDVVVEVCGVPAVVDHGVRLLRPGGTYIFVGMVTPDSQLSTTGEQIIRKCLTIKGIHNYRGDHLRQAVEFLGRTVDIYPYESLVSEPVSLEKFKEAFSLAATQKYQRVVMKPRFDAEQPFG